jgi:3-oxosteroid 1-dehydrogenase
MTQTFDESYDIVIVGSGGGSMCAALAAKELGQSALIVEKLALVGGSTGFSGGVWWVPNNPVMKRAGVSDSPERARQYLDSAVKYDGPGTTPERRDAFIRTGPKMVHFLERAGMKFVYADGARCWPNSSIRASWASGKPSSPATRGSACRCRVTSSPT